MKASRFVSLVLAAALALSVAFSSHAQNGGEDACSNLSDLEKTMDTDRI